MHKNAKTALKNALKSKKKSLSTLSDPPPPTSTLIHISTLYNNKIYNNIIL